MFFCFTGFNSAFRLIANSTLHRMRLRARVFLAQLRIGSSVNVSPKSRAIVICVPCCRRDVDENCWLHYQLSTLNVVKIGLNVSVMVMSVNSQRDHKTGYSLSVMSFTESHQRKNSADTSSRALEIELPQSTNR